MKAGALLTAALLLAVAVPHYGYEPLASMWPDPVRAARAWFYILRGFSGAGLFAVIAVLISTQPFERQQRRWYALTILVCIWGFIEETETSICRLGLGIDGALPGVRWVGLCDALIDVPMYRIGVVVLGLLGALLAANLRKLHD